MRSIYPPVAVAIVNHDTQVELEVCLESVAAEAPAQTLVVDTGSADGSAEMVKREFPNVELITTSNRGYGAGANVALARVQTPYMLLLNADTVVEPGTLESISAYLHRHPTVAVAGPLVVDSDGQTQWTAGAFPTPGQILLRETGLHHLRRLRRKQPRAGSAEWVLGAALALRRDAVQAVGGFDESYFMYNEELDLCLRLRHAGWEIHYAPVATVMHRGASSTTKQRAAMAAEYVHSTMLLYRRHLSRIELAELRLVLALAMLARLVRDHMLIASASPARRRELVERIDAWKLSLMVVSGRHLRPSSRP